MGKNKKVIFPVFIPYFGCPSKCIYCNQTLITRTSSIKIPKKELENFINIHSDDYKGIAFYGGTFTNLPQKKQKELLDEISPYIEYLDEVRVSTRPDCIDEEKLKFCKENGITVFELGIQSFSDPVLSKSKRSYTKEIAEKSSFLIKKNNFKLGIQIMPFLPGFSKETLTETIESIKKISPDFIRIYPTLVLKNTELEKIWQKGKYKASTLEETISITTEILEKLPKNIKVIKMGLHSSVKKEDIVAGGYHYAFGELVKEELFRKKLKKEKFKKLFISPKDISIFYGRGKNFFNEVQDFNGDFELFCSENINQGACEIK